MKPLADLVAQGGPVMFAILALSVVLYARCCKLFLLLWRMRRAAARLPAAVAGDPDTLRRIRDQLQDSFRQQRIALGAMVAAAPLLGLLGTVSGMTKTFESLSHRTSGESMENLAHGISEVLVATQSGLAVAIPALLLIYLAHRQVHKHALTLNRLEERSLEGRTP